MAATVHKPIHMSTFNVAQVTTGYLLSVQGDRLSQPYRGTMVIVWDFRSIREILLNSLTTVTQHSQASPDVNAETPRAGKEDRRPASGAQEVERNLAMRYISTDEPAGLGSEKTQSLNMTKGFQALPFKPVVGTITCKEAHFQEPQLQPESPPQPHGKVHTEPGTQEPSP